MRSNNQANFSRRSKVIISSTKSAVRVAPGMGEANRRNFCISSASSGSPVEGTHSGFIGPEVNPSLARRTDEMATMHRQPIPSFPSEGVMMPFIIGAMGAWQSAVPISCRSLLGSKSQSLPSNAAQATAPQEPDEWYVS